MGHELFGAAVWELSLEKYAKATGLSVELYGLDGQVVLGLAHPTPLVALFREYGYEPAVFAECAQRCLMQTNDRSVVVVTESHGLTVVGTSLMLEGEVVGVAVAGYALAQFFETAGVNSWAKLAGVSFDRLWNVVRNQAPIPERRLMLYGELLQVLCDALLLENHRTRQYEGAVLELQTMSAAKDEFLAMLSHELRNPLVPILGWAHVLQVDPSPESVRRAAEAIERNALLEARLVDDLLDANLIEHGTVRLDLRIDGVSALIRGAIETTAQAVQKKSIRLEFVDAGEPLFVNCDSGRLQQVFRNILSNAVKFTPAGGGIRVTLDREADDAVFVVADTGIGIEAQFLPFVFEIFRQQEQGTRRKYEG
ncbi:MAG: ATP-binding protein, partial [Betaproteobacteria bacterium]